jgi:outer membrane protein
VIFCAGIVFCKLIIVAATTSSRKEKIMMIRKMIRAVVVVSALALAAPAVHAEESKVAVVNVQRIMKESKAALAAREQLKAKQQQFQEEITKTEKALKAQDQELEKQRTILSQEAFEKQVKDFRKKATDAQKDVQEKRMNLSKAFDASLSEIQVAVTSILNELAKEKGFELVIPASQLLYYGPTLEISDEVLKRLNEKLPTLTVKF